MEEYDIKSPLMEKKWPSTMPSWSADTADLFILLCSFLLTTTCIVFVTLVFRMQVTWRIFWAGKPIPRETLSILQRIISSLSVTITSAVIMVAGKRYVLFKLGRGGLRSRRVAVYSSPSIGNLASYMMLRRAELPLLCLSAVWGLALATSLTVNDTWEVGPRPAFMNIALPSGPFIPATPGSSWIVPASEQLAFIVSSFCFGVADSVGLVKVTSANIVTDHPMGIVYYPPRPFSQQNIGFSFSTTMNGFNISMEHLSSIPSTAQSLTCTNSTINPVPLELYFGGSDNQTLSIIASQSLDVNANIIRFNATAIVMGGTLSSTGNYTEFALNGTSWPNVMSVDNQWAQDITSLICNTTFSPVGSCSTLAPSLSDFADVLNANSLSYSKHDDENEIYGRWSTILNMVLGAYSSAMYPHIGDDAQVVPIVEYGAHFTSQYGIYILILHIVVSLAMLVVVVRLRLASHLGTDFIHSTRLLLDPLKKPELFNASLSTTVDALGDPYMLVRDGELLVTEKTTTESRKRIGKDSLQNPFDHWK